MKTREVTSSIVFDLTRRRIRLLSAILFLLAIVIVGKLFYLQVINHTAFIAQANSNHEVTRTVLPSRGEVFVRESDDLYPLVVNKEYYLLYAEPSKIESPNRVVDVITPVLGLPEEEWKALLPRLAKHDDPYEPIRHKVTGEQKSQIEAANLPGVGFAAETYRYYPEKTIGGHVLGFVSQADDTPVGQYGLEGYFNNELGGQQGVVESIRDALGALITIGPRKVTPAQDGVDLVLTIDRQVQTEACKKIKEFHGWFEAKSATVIVMNPKTGAIMAMCNVPDFDPEKYFDVNDISNFNNPAIFQAYEPGSVMKSFTMAAALDQGVLEPNTAYEDTGELKVGKHTIRNFDLQAHGVKSMTEVLELSLNTGAMYAAEKTGKTKFKNYIYGFGFGEKTGITLASEVAGDVSSLEKPGDIFYLTASFGQGITATPLQLIAGYAALANGGHLVKPYIVSEKHYPNGEIEVTNPEVIRDVITPKTSALISGMLVSVVERGYDKKARVDGYYLAGKTGTAQIASGGGYGASTNHTFIGYGPADDPQFVILLKLEEPQKVRFASDTLGPLFKDLSAFLLDYLQVPPDY